MARRRWYRRYPRVVVAKKKWASNMKSAILTIASTTNSSSVTKSVLVTNSANTATPTPVILKTGNFKVQGDCYFNGGSTNIPVSFQFVIYVMYLPEVVANSTLSSSLVTEHPEWIMAWKAIDANVNSSVSNSTAFSFSTRMKRNLNSGDQVVLFAVASTSTNSTPEVRLSYVAQFWTCAN